MFTKENAIIEAKKFVSLCIKNRIEIKKAILFGSYAQNCYTDISDIDLALVSDSFTNNSIINNKITSKINIQFPDIEVHHFNTNYYNSGDSFTNEINAKGIDIMNY